MFFPFSFKPLLCLTRPPITKRDSRLRGNDGLRGNISTHLANGGVSISPNPVIPAKAGIPFAFFLLLLLTNLLPQTARADSYGCAPFEPPQIAVLPRVQPPRYDTSLSLASIRAMAGKPNLSSTGVREMPVGLTSAQLRTASSFEVTTQTKGRDPLVCAQITHLNLEVGFEDTTIYLAHELPPGSCAESEVNQHELRHVATDRQVLMDFAPRIQPFLQSVLQGIGTIRASSSAIAEAHLRAQIDEAMKHLTSTLAAEREAAQRQIDTPEEYQRLSAACHGELQQVLRNSR